MNIKKLVAGSMLLMLMASGMAAADWGDVYYCQMTELVKITRDGEMTKHTLEKFQFKLDQTKNAMVFGSTGYFANSVDELTTGMSFPWQEKWYAKNDFAMIRFTKGKLFYSQVGDGITTISADCEKF